MSAAHPAPDPSSAIAGAGRITAIFGRWPTFHDAEIRALEVAGSPGGFTVTVTLHTFAVTSEIDERGNYRLEKHTRLALRFGECTDLRLDSLDRHTVLFALHLVPGAEAGGAPWMVTFESSSGPDGSLTCRRIEVLAAEPWAPPAGAEGV